MNRPESTRHIGIAIVGTGFGGLGTAIRLKQEGFEDFLLFERAMDVGGVWRDNRYPGCACDVHSHLYDFSFAPNTRWSRRFSPQPEIWEYLRRCTNDFGIRPQIHFGHDVLVAEWDEEAGFWRIQTSSGAYTADVLVSASGALAEPRIPEIPGLAEFEGAIFHSARWPENVSLRGKRVAVIGTGASAIQIVPAIQPEVERLTVFQRTPPWVVPRNDRPHDERFASWLERVPALGRMLRSAIYFLREGVGFALRNPRYARFLERSARRQLRDQIPDPELRRKLTPDYTLGCKRVLPSDDYYPALTKANVEIVADAAAEIRRGGVVGTDGVERPADAIVLCTGFQVTELPFAERIRGRGGAVLSETFRPSPQAHLGTTVAGYPNLFILQGPNTGLGHTSVLLMIEAQIEHLLNALRYMDSHDVGSVEPREEAQARFVADVDREMEGTVWVAGGCRSWYLDDTGRNSTLWAGSVRSFRRRVERFRPEEYLLRPAPAHSTPPRRPAHA